MEETDYVDSEFDEGRQSVMEFLLLMSDVDKIEESALLLTLLHCEIRGAC